VLIHQKKTIELTSKENELLSLLNEFANETVTKETILHKVWGDEGHYVGRTLDVTISKLRKKLEHDASIQIKNIRGVGYRLIIEE
jgi:DNA-binding response OmpR family regulator